MKNVQAVPIAKEAGSTAVAASIGTIHSGEYPISRFLYFYLSRKPDGNVKKFIDWVISASGQKVVSEVGYYPIKKK